MPYLISTSGGKKEGIGAGTMHKCTFSSSSLDTSAISTIWLFNRCLLSAECWRCVNVSVWERDACVLLPCVVWAVCVYSECTVSPNMYTKHVHSIVFPTLAPVEGPPPSTYTSGGLTSQHLHLKRAHLPTPTLVEGPPPNTFTSGGPTFQHLH